MLPPLLSLLTLLLRLLCRCTAVVAAAAVLLLPAAVRHRVPNGQICCWFIESDPSFFIPFIQTRFVFDGTPWQYSVSHLRPRFAHILGNYGHARSQDERRPARRIPPCTAVTFRRRFNSYLVFYDLGSMRPLSPRVTRGTPQRVGSTIG